MKKNVLIGLLTYLRLLGLVLTYIGLICMIIPWWYASW